MQRLDWKKRRSLQNRRVFFLYFLAPLQRWLLIYTCYMMYIDLATSWRISRPVLDIQLEIQFHFWSACTPLIRSTRNGHQRFSIQEVSQVCAWRFIEEHTTYSLSLHICVHTCSVHMKMYLQYICIVFHSLSWALYIVYIQVLFITILFLLSESLLDYWILAEFNSIDLPTSSHR